MLCLKIVIETDALGVIMNYKKGLFAFLLINFVFYLPGMEQGKVIDPLHHHGQFTVSAAPQFTSANSYQLAPTIAQDSSQFFCTKGVPVIISMIANTVPWWALTTGTGYLLVCPCDLINPFTLCSAAAGSSYSITEYIMNALKLGCKNNILINAGHAALLATCLGISYASSNVLVDASCLAMAQAICMPMIASVWARTSNYLLPSPTTTTKNVPNVSAETNTIITADNLECIQAAIFAGLISCNSCPDLLAILLYEQAYRLAQMGCHVAQELFTK